MKQYVLDTSALITYIEEEEGHEVVASLLNQAVQREVELFISIISCIELYYISCKGQGEKIAEERLALINKLPLKQMLLAENHITVIGKIKAANTIAFADSCIAGLTKTLQATLVHKDPEYDQLLNEVTQLKLPYKIKSGLVEKSGEGKKD